MTSPSAPRGASWRKRLSRATPYALYVATWGSTLAVGTLFYGEGSIWRGLTFAAPLMIILTLHELGHYLQLRRYGLRTSPPIFLPAPLPPLGTFGAIIRISERIPDRRALFDVGVSGPLSGLAATLVFLVVGLFFSHAVPEAPPIPEGGALLFGEPLIVKWFARVILGYREGWTLLMHPTAVAAWAGLFLTTLNLFPVGQLDGGHVFYALLRGRAVYAARAAYAVAVVAVVVFQAWRWTLFLVLVAFLRLRHPATRNDAMPLGVVRTVIGWCALAFLIVGFTPNPIEYVEREDAGSSVETSIFNPPPRVPASPRLPFNVGDV